MFPKELNQDNIKDEITSVSQYRDTLNEFGEGYDTILFRIPNLAGENIVFNGFSIPEDLVQKCLKLLKAQSEFQDELGLRTLEYMKKPISEIDIYGNKNKILHALSSDNITREDKKAFLNAREFVLSTQQDFRDHYSAFGSMIKEVHNNYISFLESTLIK